jgi:hypothetical protein
LQANVAFFALFFFAQVCILRGMTSIPTCEPDSFVAGDTVKWCRSFADYPASAGWTLAYVFVNAGSKKDVASVAEGDSHLVTITAEDSADWPAGDYDFQGTATKGDERYTVTVGRTTVKPNLAAVVDGFDARTSARKVLEAIDAKIAGRASSDQLDVVEYHIGMRGLRRTEEGLTKLRGIFAAAVWREEHPGELGPIVQGTFV